MGMWEVLTDHGIVGDSRRVEGNIVGSCEFVISSCAGVSMLMVRLKYCVIVGELRASFLC